jgi:hypothetical protein
MNRKTLLIATLAGAFSLFATHTFAQTDSSGILSREEINANKREAEEAARKSEDQVKDKSRETLADLEATRKDQEANAREARRASNDAKARARDARRADNDATDAARQTRRAANAERSAQKARARADKKANQAERSIEKMDRNR